MRWRGLVKAGWLACAIVIGLTVAIVPPAAAHKASVEAHSRSHPDTCHPWVFSWRTGFATEKAAERHLRELGYEHAEGRDHGNYWMKSDFRHEGHAKGAYRWHASITKEGASYVINRQGPEPNPFQAYHFGGLYDGYRYVKWWHAWC